MPLIKKVKETCKIHKLFRKNEKVIVGVSGGPDSVALLFVLNSLSKEYGLHLHIAHLDHKIRKDSNQDRIFVENLAHRLNLPITSAVINIGRLSKTRSIEEVAREERLKFLFNAAEKEGALKIALGHNQDDQAETVLMRLIRGAGLCGISAILPKRKIGNFLIVRPLIESPRNTIEAYLKRRKIETRIDSTNKENIYFRNRIRNCLIPELSRNYNINVKEVLAHFAQIAACDYDYLENKSKRVFKKLVEPLIKDNGKIRGFSFNLAKFKRLHLSLQRMILRESIIQIKGSVRRISFKHLREIEDLIVNRPINSIVDLPQGFSVLKNTDYLCVYQKNKTSDNP